MPETQVVGPEWLRSILVRRGCQGGSWAMGGKGDGCISILSYPYGIQEDALGVLTGIWLPKKS